MGLRGRVPKESSSSSSHLLTPRDPSWFNEAWLQGISEDPGPNRRLKVTGGLRNRGQTGEELIRDRSVRYILGDGQEERQLYGDQLTMYLFIHSCIKQAWVCSKE